MLASTRRRRTDASATPEVPDTAPPGGSVALLTGCVMEGLFTGVNRATERVLRVNGYTLRAAPGQLCCGALHAHAGDMETARDLARRNIRAFEAAGADTVCANSAGCGAMMKEYGHLLRGDVVFAERAAAFGARVRDVSELLAAAGPKPASLARPVRAAYDAPCHLAHAQRVIDPPLQTLHAIGRLELVPLVESDQCCGSAGIYNLVEPGVSEKVLERKVSHIHQAAPELLVTGNPGCLMQIGAGLHRAGSHVRAVHPVELLDAAYAALSQSGREAGIQTARD
jgi:glycolate oxidase iron-sulfur subunit